MWNWLTEIRHVFFFFLNQGKSLQVFMLTYLQKQKKKYDVNKIGTWITETTNVMTKIYYDNDILYKIIVMIILFHYILC